MNQATTFRRKPTVVQAMQFTGDNGHAIKTWTDGAAYPNPVLEPGEDNPTGAYMQVNTQRGLILTANVGDYVVRMSNGGYCPWSKAHFESNYEIA